MKKIIIVLPLLLILSFPLAARAQTIALTFDADMTSGMLKRLESGLDKSLYNAEIIDILRREKIPATMFISGLWAERYPQAVKDMASDSLFEIGNHSYSHRSFTKNCYSLPQLPEKQKVADLVRAQEVITKLSGRTPMLLRFPGGCYSPNDLKIADSLDLRVIGWTFASGDAFNGNTKAIVKNVLQKATDGSVIVFHLSGGRYAPKTAEALKTIIFELKKRGYKFVTVSNLAKIPLKK